MLQSSITRDISYASSARTRSGRVLIRALENVTGRRKLIARADAAMYEAKRLGGDRVVAAS